MHVTVLVAVLLFSFFDAAFSNPAVLDPRQQCASGYQPCNPSGSTMTSVPEVGQELSSLYMNLLASIPTSEKQKGDVQHVTSTVEARDVSPVCCVENMQCLLMQGLEFPFCYDKFTTNFFLPDGSYGSVTSGDYVTADGDQANLLSGNYTLADGSGGNIYGNNMADKPNTATLNLPTPFTSSGVGSAIPASGLGGFQTYLTAVETILTGPTTVSPRTVSATQVSGSSIPASTVPAITIEGTTTAKVTVDITMTSTSEASATAGTTGQATSTNAAGQSLLDGVWRSGGRALLLRGIPVIVLYIGVM